MNYRKERIAALCLSLSSGMFSQMVSAQQRPDPGQLEEIIVTAEKRETTVQNTPISLTAVSGQDIQARGLTDLADLVQSVPGVSLRTSGVYFIMITLAFSQMIYFLCESLNQFGGDNGLNITDHKCVDFLLMNGPLPAGWSFR